MSQPQVWDRYLRTRRQAEPSVQAVAMIVVMMVAAMLFLGWLLTVSP